MKTSKERQDARDKPCMVRVPGACNRDPATTVLAHYSLAGISGKGLKSPDHMGAYACSGCHDEIDGRTRITEFNKDQLRKMHAEGVMRTQEYIRRKAERPWEEPCL
jgi:hypothetical protein